MSPRPANSAAEGDQEVGPVGHDVGHTPLHERDHLPGIVDRPGVKILVPRPDGANQTISQIPRIDTDPIHVQPVDVADRECHNGRGPELMIDAAGLDQSIIVQRRHHALRLEMLLSKQPGDVAGQLPILAVKLELDLNLDPVPAPARSLP